jgi:putative SOS response-associated peptidase YedK
VCGRFSFAAKARIIEDRFDVESDEALILPRYNCAPSQNLAVISNAEPSRLSMYRWGLIPVWAKDSAIGAKTINAKAETILEKPSFRQPFKKRRCLVPADSFYEWQKDRMKTPFRIMMNNEDLFAMAGIWDAWINPQGEEVRSFSILTTIANDLVAGIHHRMPVILKREDEQVWLESTDEQQLLSLLQPYDPKAMKAYPISRLVNSPAYDHEDIHSRMA